MEVIWFNVNNKYVNFLRIRQTLITNVLYFCFYYEKMDVACQINVITVQSQHKLSTRLFQHSPILILQKQKYRKFNYNTLIFVSLDLLKIWFFFLLICCLNSTKILYRQEQEIYKPKGNQRSLGKNELTNKTMDLLPCKRWTQ